MVKLFRLEELSESENVLVQEATQKYGAYYKNANSLVSFMWNFIDKYMVQAHIVFMSFYSQVCTSMSQALLSAVRRHDIQTMHMLRHVLESAVLASYSFYNHNSDDYAVVRDDGLCEIKDNIRGKAYKWIDANYKKYSDTIAYIKTEHINKLSAHASIGHGFYNTDYAGEGRVTIGFFDGSSQDGELRNHDEATAMAYIQHYTWNT